ncbi:MAG: hypothetical protein H6R10_2438 [Rhodocyclaceae bacterium]|nr:hypothetical protein [Rhodocyclaceae bacterium]
MFPTLPPLLLGFRDLQAGMDYISRLPLANPSVANEQINQFLDNFLAAPLDHAGSMALLEHLRGPLAFVQEELARRCHDKPLVLGELEDRIFQRVVATWHKLIKAYALCAARDPASPGDPGYGGRRATILQRSLHGTGMIILEHYRARRELPEGVWLDLHGYYEAAEQLGVATTPVANGGDDSTTHCSAAYVASLLIEVASPYSHTVRDINLIRRWAGLWAPLVSVEHLADGESPPYVVELTRDAGLHPLEEGRPEGVDRRRLDTSRLAAKVGNVLKELRQKVSATRLGLGEERSSHVIALLEQLVRPWSQLAAARRFRRFATSGTARVCTGFEASHFFVSGRPFEQPLVGNTYSRDEFALAFSFRERNVPGQRPCFRPDEDYDVDSWDVINHSANGFRLARSMAGQKMSHGQLLALCPPDGGKFLLGYSTWLMQEHSGGLVAGVAVLPGLPAGVAVRMQGSGQEREQPFVRGFLLSPVAGLADKGCLLLPTGTYQASRVFEIHAGGLWRVRVKNLLQRGMDFERVSFETV